MSAILAHAKLYFQRLYYPVDAVLNLPFLFSINKNVNGAYIDNLGNLYHMKDFPPL